MVAPEEDRAALASQADYDAGLRLPPRRPGPRCAADPPGRRPRPGPGPAVGRPPGPDRRAPRAREPLAVQTAVRLAAAGLTPDDPGLAGITDWNGRARHQAAEREAS